MPHEPGFPAASPCSYADAKGLIAFTGANQGNAPARDGFSIQFPCGHLGYGSKPTSASLASPGHPIRYLTDLAVFFREGFRPSHSCIERSTVFSPLSSMLPASISDLRVVMPIQTEVMLRSEL